MKEKKKRRNYLLYVLLGLVLIVVGYFLFGSKNEEQSFYVVKSRKMTEGVYASGNILPKNEYRVFSMADGIVLQKMVSEGDEVAQNQVLFVINDKLQNLRLSNSQSNYQIAQRNYSASSPVLKELEANIRNAKNKMQQDSVNYQRFRNLYKANATSKTAYEEAKLGYQTSKNNYLLQVSRYQKAKNDLLLNLENAETQVALNAEQAGDYLVRSLIDGRVFEVYKEQGEAIRRGEAIALVGATDAVYIQLEVDELDIDKIKVGQEVLVQIDVYKDKIFKAKVSKIYQMLNRQNQSFRVDAEFVDTYPSLYAGLTVEANIIIQRKPKALVIPKSYLLGEDSIWVLKGDEKKKIRIKKGIENFEWVEVRSGIKENSKILKP